MEDNYSKEVTENISGKSKMTPTFSPLGREWPNKHELSRTRELRVSDRDKFRAYIAGPELYRKVEDEVKNWDDVTDWDKETILKNIHSNQAIGSNKFFIPMVQKYLPHGQRVANLSDLERVHSVDPSFLLGARWSSSDTPIFPYVHHSELIEKTFGKELEKRGFEQEHWHEQNGRITYRNHDTPLLVSNLGTVFDKDWPFHLRLDFKDDTRVVVDNRFDIRNFVKPEKREDWHVDTYKSKFPFANPENFVELRYGSKSALEWKKPIELDEDLNLEIGEFGSGKGTRLLIFEDHSN